MLVQQRRRTLWRSAMCWAWFHRCAGAKELETVVASIGVSEWEAELSTNASRRWSVFWRGPFVFLFPVGPRWARRAFPLRLPVKQRSNELTRHKWEEKKHTYPSQSTRLPLKLCKLTRRELMLPERVRLYREQRSTSCCRLTFLSSLIFF